jgi:hypothetical protein
MSFKQGRRSRRLRTMAQGMRRSRWNLVLRFKITQKIIFILRFSVQNTLEIRQIPKQNIIQWLHGFLLDKRLWLCQLGRNNQFLVHFELGVAGLGNTLWLRSTSKRNILVRKSWENYLNNNTVGPVGIWQFVKQQHQTSKCYHVFFYDAGHQYR